MKKSTDFFPALSLRQQVLKLLASTEDFGGPQSVNDLRLSLKISNGSSRSVLVRLHKSDNVERIGKGIYRIKGDSRDFNGNKLHLS